MVSRSLDETSLPVFGPKSHVIYANPVCLLKRLAFLEPSRYGLG